MRTCTHGFYQSQDFIHVLPRSDEALQDQQFEVVELIGSQSAHHLDELHRQLERRRLETEIPRGQREDEAEVDVDEVAFAVYQNVAVVPETFHQNVKQDQE